MSRAEARGVLVAVGLVFAALALRLLLDRVLAPGGVPYATFFASAAIAAWFGGRRPGLVATALGGALAWYFFVPPFRSLRVDKDDPVGLGMYLAVAAVIVWLNHRLREETARCLDAEERERQGRQLVETTLHSIGDGVITTDGEARVSFMNPVAERLTGWAAGEAAGRPIEEVLRIVDEDTRTPAPSPVRRALDEGGAVGFANHTLLITRGGAEETIDDSAAPILGGDGKPRGAVVVFRSVARERRAERERRRLDQRLASLVDNTPLAVVEWDHDFRVTRWSGEAERVFGWCAAEIVGRRIDEFPFVHEDDRERVTLVMDELLRPENRYVVSHNRNRTKSGEARSCEWYNSVLRDEQGRMQAILSLVLDVTEREELEQGIRERERRKDEFLAVLAHELRNPLAPMRNALEILRLAGRDEKAAVSARGLLERQLAQMVRLIDDLLDVSRISLGRLQLRRERVPVDAVIASAVETSRPVIEAFGHELVVSLPDGTLWLDADVTRLAQVVLNLLNNSARYMERGGRIELRAAREGGEVVVRVRDRGLGIEPHVLPHVFEMFAQGSRLPSRAAEGLGIGLTLVRRLVDLHGGSVEAHSEGAGRGSEFVVRLPEAPAPAPTAGTAAAAGRASAPRASEARRVLVVDDNSDAAVSLAAMLRIMGHEARTAHDGPAALETAAQFRPDIVLLDIGMPGMTGYEVAGRLRGMPWSDGVVLVALTGWGQDEDRRRSREAGFDHHLVKPVQPEVLARLVSSLGRG